jgi:hypothetical protein
MKSINRVLVVIIYMASMIVDTKKFPPSGLPSTRNPTYLSIIRSSGGLSAVGANLEFKDVDDETYVSQLQTASDLNDAGFILLQSSEFAKAEELFQAALQQDPNHPAALCNYGRLLIRRQRVSFVNQVCT